MRHGGERRDESRGDVERVDAPEDQPRGPSLTAGANIDVVGDLEWSARNWVGATSTAPCSASRSWGRRSASDGNCERVPTDRGRRFGTPSCRWSSGPSSEQSWADCWWARAGGRAEARPGRHPHRLCLSGLQASRGVTQRLSAHRPTVVVSALVSQACAATWTGSRERWPEAHNLGRGRRDRRRSGLYAMRWPRHRSRPMRSSASRPAANAWRWWPTGSMLRRRWRRPTSGSPSAPEPMSPSSRRAACCSCASTTLAARRWQPASCATSGTSTSWSGWILGAHSTLSGARAHRGGWVRWDIGVNRADTARYRGRPNLGSARLAEAGLPLHRRHPRSRPSSWRSIR